MQHIPTIDAAKRAFRAVICPHCQRRPHGSESFPPNAPRACEAHCPIFLQVEQLRRLAEQPGHFDTQIREEICNRTCHHPTAGDFCPQRTNGSCPLTCFGNQAMSILSGLVAAEQIARDRINHGIHQMK